jgi:4-amino-4-deoxy-L-arabinose transferase-like glycosyltransferase
VKDQSRAVVIAMVILATAYLLFNMSTLVVYPFVGGDEGFYSSQAYNLLTDGTPGLPLLGEWYGASQNYVPTGRLYLVSLALVFKILGASLFSARLFSLLGGIVAVYWTFRLGEALYEGKVGVGAAIVLATSHTMFFNAHFGRMDVWLGAMIPFVAYVYVRTQGQHGLGLIGVGLLSALLLDIHWNGIYFIVGFAVAWIAQHRGEPRFIRSMSKYAIGLAIGGLYWLGAHFLPDPFTAWSQWTSGFSEVGFAPRLTNVAQNVSNQFGTWWQTYVHGRSGLGIIEGAYSLLGFAYALRQRTKGDVFLLVVLLAATSLFTVLSVQKLLFYRIVWAPLVAVLIARAVVGLGGFLGARLGLSGQSLVAGCVLVPLVVASLGANLYLGYRFSSYPSYNSEVQTIRSWVLPNSPVIGTTKYWYGFQDSPYLGIDVPSIPFSSSTYSLGQVVTSDDTKRYLVEFVSGLKRHGVSRFSIIDLTDLGSCGETPCEGIGYIKQFAPQWCRVRGTFNSYASYSLNKPTVVSVYWCESQDNWLSAINHLDARNS